LQQTKNKTEKRNTKTSNYDFIAACFFLCFIRYNCIRFSTKAAIAAANKALKATRIKGF
jgi:hypothetical protein